MKRLRVVADVLVAAALFAVVMVLAAIVSPPLERDRPELEADRWCAIVGVPLVASDRTHCLELAHDAATVIELDRWWATQHPDGSAGR